MPLKLDDFTKGHYTKTLLPGPPDTNNQTLFPPPPPPPLGPTRQTVFTNAAPSLWNQPSRLDIGIQNGTGIFIVDSGFGAQTSVLVKYGAYINPTPPPLHLNLSKYSAFRINFAGVSASIGITATVDILDNKGLSHDVVNGGLGPPFLPASESPFSIDYPFTSFFKSNGPFDLSDIFGVQVGLGGAGVTFAFGITSFEAAP